MGKNVPRILTIFTRELVAAEACYHKSCYRDNTRNIQGAVSNADKKEEDECPEYMQNHRICLRTSKHVCSKTRRLLEWLSCTPYLPLS